MYLGNQPALNYTSLATQTFTAVTGQTQYSLDHSVANGNDILLYIANVKQVEGNSNSYTATGNILTLNTAISAGTEMYCLFVSKAIQTVNPPNASVGASQLIDASITSGKLASGVLPTNTPAFHVNLGGTEQSVPTSSSTKLAHNTEVFDTDNAFDTTNYRFTVPSGKAGKYYFYATARVNSSAVFTRLLSMIFQNGSNKAEVNMNNTDVVSTSVSVILDLNVGDYVEHYVYQNGGNNKGFKGSTLATYFLGYKLIG